MLLSVEELVDHLLLVVLVSQGVGQLGVDVEKDVLVSVSVWLAVNLACWSFVAAMSARNWSTVCRVVVVAVDGLEMGLLSVIVGVTGLRIGLLLDIGDCRMQLAVEGWLGQLTVVQLFGVLENSGLGMQLGVAVFMVLDSGPATGDGFEWG